MNEDRIVDIAFIIGYLTIIILRICNVIDWSWLWILCPFWLAAGGALIGVILGLGIGLSLKLYRKIRGILNERY